MDENRGRNTDFYQVMN